MLTTAVVEHEIDEEMLAVKGEPLLPGLEQEAFAQFQQESLDLVDDGPFQVGFGIAGLFGRAEELQDQRLLEEVQRLADDLPFPRPPNALLVAAQGQTFVQAAVELAPQFAQVPVLVGGFDFVETALVRILDPQQKDVMGSTQAEGPRLGGHGGQLPSLRLGNFGLIPQDGQ